MRALALVVAAAAALAPRPRTTRRRVMESILVSAVAPTIVRANQPAVDEVSGLAVLRVAQVADFQEKLLREVAKGADLGVPVTPQQFVFGTTLLLKNISKFRGRRQFHAQPERGGAIG